MQRSSLVLTSGLALLALVLIGATAAQAIDPQEWSGITLPKCCIGGDIRIRQVHFDDIPWNVPGSVGPARGGENHFFRFRTRLWAQIDPAEDVTINTRVVNEFREYEEGNNAWEFLDEVVVDKLNIELRNLMDGNLDVKVGRQDLIYGTGKVILEGTPLDGSRTIYFDAAKVTCRRFEDTTVDLLGIYQEAENELVVNSEDRNLTGFHPADEQATEWGAGVYAKNGTLEAVPLELYYIYKNTEDYMNRAELPIEEQDLHTLGTRLMPKLSDALSGNVEFAWQFGEQGQVDLEGLMLDATLTYALPVLEAMKPAIGLGWYYLSGDDPDSPEEDERWVPVWARWPQYSELYVYSWDADGAGSWGNLSMPHVDLMFAPWQGAKSKLMVANLMAPEENGFGGGDERGLLVTFRTDFTLAKGLLHDQDKLFAHLLFEYLDAGDYYAEELEEAAHFARWELSYAF